MELEVIQTGVSVVSQRFSQVSAISDYERRTPTRTILKSIDKNQVSRMESINDGIQSQRNASVRRLPRLITATFAVLRTLCVLIALDSYSCLAYGQDTFYSVQAGSYKNPRNAAKALAHLQTSGFDPFCRFEAVEDKGNWYRIFVGRFESRAHAEAMTRRLTEETSLSGLFITTLKDPADPYFLHISSYVLRAQAEQETRSQEKGPFKPFFKEEYVDGQTWFRVFIGPFSSEQDAGEVGSELKKQGLISYFSPTKIDKDLEAGEKVFLTAEPEKTHDEPEAAEEETGLTEGPDHGITKGHAPPLLMGEKQKKDVAVEISDGGDSDKGMDASVPVETGDVAGPESGQATKTIKQAEALMAEGKAAEAYELLAPLEAELAGDIGYDYLLAIAGLDSGNPAKASLVFERILAIRPDFAGARLDMARAFFALGNYDQAKTEFEALLKLDPPPQAKAVSERYLEAITKGREVKATTVSGYVEATLGNDDNVNNSTGSSQAYVPALAVNMTLSETNVQTADSYSTLAGGVTVNRQLNSEFSSYLGVDGSARRNFHDNEFDTDSIGVSGGMRFSKGSDAFRLGLKAQRFWLDDSTNRKTVGLDGDWRHLFNQRNQVILFSQYNENRYPDTDVNNADQLLGGLSWLHALDAPYNPVLFASGYVGGEDDRNKRADGGKFFYGMRVGGQADIHKQISLFANIGGQAGDYDKTNAAFLNTREDLQFDVRLGLSWRPKKDWTIKPQIAYIENDSNIPINEYDRTDVSVSVRRDFR